VLVRLSTGTSFAPEVEWANNNIWGGPGWYGFDDLNGDGRQDLWFAIYGTSRLMVRLSTGASFAPEVEWANNSLWAGTEWYGLADLNGDGQLDLWFVNPGTSRLLVRSANSPRPDLVSSVSAGQGAVTTVSYKAITDEGVYTKDSGANVSVYPVLDIVAPLYVVSSFSSTNGVGGLNTVHNNYGGLKVEMATGRGSMGFRWMKSKEATTGIETYREYRQDFPFVGMVSKSETRLVGSGSGGVLKRATATFGCKIPQNAAACAVTTGSRYFPYIATTLEESWDINGAAYPSLYTSYVYGQNPVFGDPTQITVTNNGDGSSKTTVNEYWPADVTNWILGRLKTATVTSIKP
jgi:hypothetical protein